LNTYGEPSYHLYEIKIKKRDGRIVDFDPSKIRDAIHRAFIAVELEDGKKAEEITTEVVELLEGEFRENTSFQSYYAAHPSKAEDIAVAKILRCLTEQTAKIHFCHISSLRSLRLIKTARAEGKHVTCEATPHHMLLSTESSSKLGGISIMDPPLRKKAIAERLFGALKDE
jgi:dihydroorotase